MEVDEAKVGIDEDVHSAQDAAEIDRTRSTFLRLNSKVTSLPDGATSFPNHARMEAVVFLLPFPLLFLNKHSKNQ